MSESALPKPAKRDSRICFGIVYLTSEEDAQAWTKHVVEKGHTYNGGFYDGMPCGRAEHYDHVDPELGRLYAVTTR